MNFISPVFSLSNLPKQNTSKIKLTKQDVSLMFVLSRATSIGYKIRFLVSINTIPNSFYGEQIRASHVDMVSLHDAIIQNIDVFDRKYVTLKQFDTVKCEFIFNFDKWFKDAIQGSVPKTYLSKFNQELKLKIQPPKMIMFDPMRSMFFDFLIKEFKEHLKKTNKDKKWFGSLLPKEFQKKLNVRFLNMFNYEYDYMNNRFLIILKSEYIIGASFLTGTIINGFKKEKFSDRVEKNSKNFNNIEWKDFIKKKFI